MLKRLLSLLLLPMLMLPVINAQAEEVHPVIALTHTPALNDESDFVGVVFTPDGSAFDASDYRILLYVSNQYGAWPKPTYEHPYADIASDGTFSIQYSTASSDALCPTIYVLLVKSTLSVVPSISLYEAQAAAVDMVTVRRQEDGSVTMDPEREAPSGYFSPGVPARDLHTAGRKIAMDVGFHIDGSALGSTLTEARIREVLKALQPWCDTVRFYSTSDSMMKAYTIAHSMGFKIIGNASIGGNDEEEQLENLVSLANQGIISVAVVGNEMLLEQNGTVRMTEDELIGKIRDTREKITDPSLPVTTSETFGDFMKYNALRDACDLILVNSYPIFDGCSAVQAAGQLRNVLNTLQARVGEKQIILGETGWPANDANTRYTEDAGLVFEELMDLSRSMNIIFVWFEFADEPVKGRTEFITTAAYGTINGGDWGLFNSDLTIKKAYADLDFFHTPDILTLPGETLSVEAEAFRAADLERVSCNDALQEIGALAFADNPRLSSISIPDSVSAIAPDAFEGSPDVVILCSDTSYAAQYAESSGIPHREP